MDVQNLMHERYKAELKQVAALSQAYEQSRQKEYIRQIYEFLLDARMLTKENRLYVYEQMKYLTFMNGDAVDIEIETLSLKCYQYILELFKEELALPDYVPVEKRTKKYVVCFINQYLTEGHAPTKTMLDRCYLIAKGMGLAPFIINTADLLTQKGKIPFAGAVAASYVEENLDLETVSYKGMEFLFLQCEPNMPNIESIQTIVNFVKELNPYFIIDVGGQNLTGGICSSMYPLIAVNTVPSGRVATAAQFQLIGRPLCEEDARWRKLNNKTENHLVYCPFNWTLRPQKETFAREQFGLPEDRKLLLVVGGRLDEEVDSEFLQVLQKAVNQGGFVVFAGKFKSYDEKMEQNPVVAEASRFLGYVDELLALAEICDIYVNPKRTGGGGGAIEAMSMGLPVVSLPGGDVALYAGADFVVDTYPEMNDRIYRYMTDEKYYAEHVVMAKARAAYTLDGERLFLDAVHRIEKMPEFQ